MTDPTSPSLPPAAQPAGIPLQRSMAARLRNYFLAGVLVTAPMSITVYVAWSVVDYVDSGVAALIPSTFRPITALPFGVPGLGIVVLALAFTLIGFLTTNFMGRMMVRFGESAVARMPVVRGIYSAVKQIFETVLSDKPSSFSEVVLVEFPRKEMWALGLVIGHAPGEVQQKAGVKLFSVYVPTAPNPTSGYLVFLARRDMTSLEMTVDDCLKMVISGGIVVPPTRVKPARTEA